MLEDEFKYYEENRKHFIDKYLHKYIVIKNKVLLGVYDSQTDAITESLKENELGSFLVQFVEENQPPIIFRSRIVYE